METLSSTTATGHPVQLVDETLVADCIKCPGGQAAYRLWQAMEDNSVNEHWSIQCPDCGFEDDDMKPRSKHQAANSMP